MNLEKKVLTYTFISTPTSGLQKDFSPVEHVKNTIFRVGALNP